jgi:uracil-DNA glycosylase
MLSEVGIARHECYTTNVFNLRPQPKNDIDNLCGPKGTALVGYPAIKSGKYIRAEYAGELQRLYREIQSEAPNLIIALGASASWALLQTSGIKKVRGAPSVLTGAALDAVGVPVKVLPTYHPAAILREWSLRAITVMDLHKAARESLFPDLRRPSREIWTAPTLDDLEVFERDYILPAPDLSIDIETGGWANGIEQITCVGFAPTNDRAIVVPFVDPMQKDGNYWRTLQEEVKAWEYVRRWCLMKKQKVGQNFLYDAHRLWKQLGIPVDHQDDTMLLHHALQPELEKGLGFLGSIYTDELPWKFMRPKHETLKRED